MSLASGQNKVSDCERLGQIKEGSTPGSFTLTNLAVPGTKIVSCRKYWSVEKRGIEDGQVYTPTDVAFLQDGAVVVSEFDNERIQIFDTNSDSLAVLSEGEICPRGIAVDLVANNILVTDDYNLTIKIFSIEGQQPSIWKRSMFRKPHGVAVSSSGNVIVTDIDTNAPKISIFEPDGRKITDFGSAANNWLDLVSPTYVDVDDHGRIIVSDRDAHQVKIFDERGKKLTEFGGWGEKDGQLRWPNGVAADVHDNIFVADNGNNRVSLFSSAGKFIQHILTRKEGIIWPEGVAVSDNGLLAITENGIENDAVKLFQV